MFGFGFIYFFTSYQLLFIFQSIALRILQGVSRAIYQIVNFAYLSIFWKETFVKKLGLMETMAWFQHYLYFISIGLMLGPFIGAFLNYCFGYAVPLFIFSALVILCALAVNITIPSD
jgi:MFS family permease